MIMAECPDCDAAEIQLIPLSPKGNGRCSVCHGEGKTIVLGFENVCYKCNGTGICPTCRGAGEI